MPRKLRKPTAERLRRRALAYLERFSTSRAHLRFVLLRRARPEALAFEIGESELAACVDTLLHDLERLELVDDRRFALGHARSLIDRGKPASRIRAALSAKGVAGDVVDEVLGELIPSTVENDLEGAMRLARRRGLGPYRSGEVNDDIRRKEMGKFARAGFSYAIARKIIDMRSENETE